jgi:hypothetical protein
MPWPWLRSKWPMEVTPQSMSTAPSGRNTARHSTPAHAAIRAVVRAAQPGPNTPGAEPGSFCPFRKTVPLSTRSRRPAFRRFWSTLSALDRRRLRPRSRRQSNATVPTTSTQMTIQAKLDIDNPQRDLKSTSPEQPRPRTSSTYAAQRPSAHAADRARRCR